jgi:hypothetical protein
MSILSLGRSAPIDRSNAPRERWWNWNPARPKSAAASVEAAAPEAWWRWNPYRRDINHAEAQGRRQGYAKGERHERRVMAHRRRRRHPIFAFVVLVAAVSGLGFAGLAYEAGSFAGGGAIVDQKLGEWRADLMGAASRAVDQGGHAVQGVGQSISSQSQQLSQRGE